MIELSKKPRGTVKPLDMTAIFKKYDGKWVALEEISSKPEVICSGKNLQDVLARARELGHKNPIVFEVSGKLSHAIL